MTTEPRQGSQALPAGLDAVRMYNQLGRDLVTLWVATAEQMIRLSVDTNQVAIERVRATLGRWAAPGGSEVWNWWASTAARFLGAYRETLEKGAAPAPAATTTETEEPTIEVDVTETATDVRSRERVAAADMDTPKATASTSRRRSSGGADVAGPDRDDGPARGRGRS